MVPPRSPPCWRRTRWLPGPFGHQTHDRLGRRPELRRGGLGKTGQVPRRLDHRHLHAETDAEIGDVALTGEPRRLDLAFRPTLAEAAGHQNGVGALKPLLTGFRIAFEGVGLDPVDIDLDVVRDPAVVQGLDQDL